MTTISHVMYEITVLSIITCASFQELHKIAFHDSTAQSLEETILFSKNALK